MEKLEQAPRDFKPGDHVAHKDGTDGTVNSVHRDGTIAVEWNDGTWSELEPWEQSRDLEL